MSILAKRIENNNPIPEVSCWIKGVFFFSVKAEMQDYTMRSEIFRNLSNLRAEAWVKLLQ